MLSFKCSHRSIERGLQSRLLTGLLSCYDGAFENLPGSRTPAGLTKTLGRPLDTADRPIIKAFGDLFQDSIGKRKVKSLDEDDRQYADFLSD